MWTHAKTYEGLCFDKIIHKSRLRKLLNIFRNFQLNKEGIWADFGCSDGFILNHIRDSIVPDRWKLYGFDISNDLLSQAKKRGIPNSIFEKLDLNKVDIRFPSLFDIVSCLETLEHTGNYKNAFKNIYLSAKVGGLIVFSVPNEIGFPGCIKFIGRKLLRKAPYRSFFNDSNEIRYFIALLTGEDIEAFRNPKSKGWGPHLGFNYKNLEKYMLTEYVKKGGCNIEKTQSSFLGFNKIYVLRKYK